MAENLKLRRKEIGFAILLITIGLNLCLANVFKQDFVGLLFLPSLGVSFFVWALLSREEGFLIPAQILFSIGVAGILVSKVFGNISAFRLAGVNLASMGAGWTVMPALSWLCLKKKMNWSFIPGGILLFLGAVFIMPESTGHYFLEALSWVGKSLRYVWPFAFIVTGVVVFVKVFKGDNK